MEGYVYSLFVLYQLVFIFFQLRAKSLASEKHCPTAEQAFKDYCLAPLLIIIAFIFPSFPNHDIWLCNQMSIYSQVFGCAALIFAAVLRGWASLALGKSWSEKIDIYQEHQLITDGPYRFVKHPIYASYFWWSVGTFLVNGSITIFVLTFFYAGLNNDRSFKEELLLEEKFGCRYKEYAQKIGNIMPLHLEYFLAIVVLIVNLIGGADELCFMFTGDSFTAKPFVKLVGFLLQ